MTSDQITICICTYKRPEMLKNLLEHVERIQTGSLFTISIRIIDNDSLQSAYDTVNDFKKKSKYPVMYLHEPARSITLARNRGIANTDSLIAFIDDDEFPHADWLLNLYKTLKVHKVAGVLGPVVPHFDNIPPQWLLRSKLCERENYPTGHVLHWSQTRTGNVLLSKEVLKNKQAQFLSKFGTGGGDVDFFKRLMSEGFKFVWCNEGIVYERVPLKRQRKKYFCKRAILQGSNSIHYVLDAHCFTEKIVLFLKTISAIVLYTIALPVFRLAGDHVFMKYLVKNCHHIGRLLSMGGLSLIKRRDI